MRAVDGFVRKTGGAVVSGADVFGGVGFFFREKRGFQRGMLVFAIVINGLYEGFFVDPIRFQRWICCFIVVSKERALKGGFCGGFMGSMMVSISFKVYRCL